MFRGFFFSIFFSGIKKFVVELECQQALRHYNRHSSLRLLP